MSLGGLDCASYVPSRNDMRGRIHAFLCSCWMAMRFLLKHSAHRSVYLNLLCACTIYEVENKRRTAFCVCREEKMIICSWVHLGSVWESDKF